MYLDNMRSGHFGMRSKHTFTSGQFAGESIPQSVPRFTVSRVSVRVSAQARECTSCLSFSCHISVVNNFLCSWLVRKCTMDCLWIFNRQRNRNMDRGELGLNFVSAGHDAGYAYAKLDKLPDHRRGIHSWLLSIHSCRYLSFCSDSARTTTCNL